MLRVRTISRKGQEEINPWYIAGFVDGEGTFHVAFTRRTDLPLKWSIMPEFHVSQNGERAEILSKIKNYLNCGYIKPNHPNSKKDKTKVLVVRNRNDLTTKIIPFFERYALLTKKGNDFRTFKKIVLLMQNNSHHNKKGFQKIVNLAYSMNGGGRYRKVSKKVFFSS